MRQLPVFPPRERAIATEPPLRTDAGGACSPAGIHDAYIGDHERQRAAEEAARARQAAAKRGAAPGGAAEGDGGTADGHGAQPGAALSLTVRARWAMIQEVACCVLAEA